MAIVSKLFIMSYFFICFYKTLGAFVWCVYHGGPFVFLVVVRYGMGVCVWVCGISMGEVQPFFC